MRYTVPAAAVLVLTTSALLAQTTNATIYGSVSDKSGAAIPNGRVTLINSDTDVRKTANSNERGEFTFTFVPVGNYTLTAEGKGFKDQKLTGLTLTAGHSLRMNLVLDVADVSSAVTVIEAAPLVNTTNPEQHFSLNTEQDTELPTLQRDWTQLLNIGNGIVTNNDGRA